MRSRPTLTWSPGPDVLSLAPGTTDVAPVADVLRDGCVVVLSGAGISTESGIPDYRGVTGSLRTHTPMTYGDFVGSESGRQRYWARSHLGWRTIARADPNAGHRAVATLQAGGYVDGVITQNVDGLHGAAGARDVIELHGNLDRVICLDCRQTTAREELDRRLQAANPAFEGEATRINPDGDVELPEEVVRTFHLVGCTNCGSRLLKPDVVFFGENVPKPRVERCYRLIDDARAILVLGSSLTVMSGFRFVRYAAKAAKPVLIINQGHTRGDLYAAVRVNLPLGEALTSLTDALGR
ncbi:NAD-dependent protein deacetylase [Kribbella sp. CA-293567]|uniref:NAD-dependent protein deacetylase n=1 Tax=Kribbella sp. CA-293567 TaxID=3002436 RepID=UPI0022DD7377|nr:NAD-dependent protein deacetylase [Kribbella sp. CA-293567]WBQ02528.1 NAD-dependent protein deacetylase [Kribbella sp. CA-293567]